MLPQNVEGMENKNHVLWSFFCIDREIVNTKTIMIDKISFLIIIVIKYLCFLIINSNKVFVKCKPSSMKNRA